MLREGYMKVGEFNDTHTHSEVLDFLDYTIRKVEGYDSERPTLGLPGEVALTRLSPVPFFR